MGRFDKISSLSHLTSVEVRTFQYFLIVRCLGEESFDDLLHGFILLFIPLSVLCGLFPLGWI